MLDLYFFGEVKIEFQSSAAKSRIKKQIHLNLKTNQQNQ